MQKLFRFLPVTTLFVGMSVAANAADLPMAPAPQPIRPRSHRCAGI